VPGHVLGVDQGDHAFERSRRSCILSSMKKIRMTGPASAAAHVGRAGALWLNVALAAGALLALAVLFDDRLGYVRRPHAPSE